MLDYDRWPQVDVSRSRHFCLCGSLIKGPFHVRSNLLVVPETDVCTWLNATSKTQAELVRKVRKHTMFSVVHVFSLARNPKLARQI